MTYAQSLTKILKIDYWVYKIMPKKISEGCELQIRPQGVTGPEIGFDNLMVLSKFTFPRRAKTSFHKSVCESLGQSVEGPVRLILNPLPRTRFGKSIYDSITPEKENRLAKTDN